MQTSNVLETLSNIIFDCSQLCLTEGSRDVVEITNRVQHEGDSFFTITLPNFAKDFEKCLELGMVAPDLFTGWRKRRGLPEFLKGFLVLCFDPQTGRIRDDEKVKIAIKAVRQVCLFAKKINLACSDQRIRSAFRKYKKTDNDLAEITPVSIDDVLINRYRYVSRAIVGRLFPGRINSADLHFRHGPGSTSEMIRGNQKYVPSYSWPKRLQNVGIGPEIAYSSEECYHDDCVTPPLIDECDELPVRVVSVPKTLKTPRIIAMEPVAMQMAQQGVKGLIVDTIEAHSWTKGHINFSDQSINRQLALDSSISRRSATLDLEEASDRVPTWLVELLFGANLDLQELVLTCRSKVAELPDGERIVLNKYASMGSALCFPVEALHFFVMLIVAGLEHKALPNTPENIYLVSREYYVYGDDIICPIDQVNSVIDIFQQFGSIVSRTKSFYRGSFRESCGMDAYNGFDVTPVYMRNTLPNRRCEVSSIISSIETANQLLLKGYAYAAEHIRKKVESLIGSLPEVTKESGGLGWICGMPGTKQCPQRFNKRLQRLEVQSYTLRINFESDPIGGRHALTKCLFRLESKVQDKFGIQSTYKKSWDNISSYLERLVSISDKEHLWRTPRLFRTVTLKRGWVTCS